MQIHCPNCRAQINSKPPKPGKYTPTCPKCATPFALVVPADPEQAASVRRLPAEVSASPEATADFGGYANAATQEATGEHSPRPAHEQTTPLATSPYHDTAESAVDPEATADFDAPAAAKAKRPAAVRPPDLPERLGGYALGRQLGAGGMGAVYLARQVSLDRDVALKVMHANWASDPVFLARFTREAYAAAQLNHHNVVQIYDVGSDAGVSFFSMEFVEGKSLGQVLLKSRTVEPAVAVGYVIQAACGLKYAHDRGMVHRDIKPDNLMLNVEGVVKVADLGLVKTRGMTATDDAAPTTPTARGAGPSKLQAVSADVTSAGTAMGTPSFMAPEQCRDASAVDLRADIYSLGCTLYALLAGRTPFQGKTAVELIAKHLNDAPPPLEAVAPGVPRELAAIVGKTLAKGPADRYQTMGEFVAALRGWQEASKAGPPRASDEQIHLLEALTGQLRDHPLAKFGAKFAAALPLAGLAAGTLLLFVKSSVGGAILLATVSAVATGFVASGLLTGSHLFRKAREWAFGARVLDWLTAVVAALLFLVALYFAGLLLPGLVGVALGALLGVGFALGVSRPVAARRAKSRDDFNAVLKRLRLAGMDEDGVREVLVLTADKDWELAYETVYGYPAKLAKRAELAAKGDARLKFAAWRDGLIERLDAAAEARTQARARRHLQGVEQRRLVAEGVSAADAKGQAHGAADDLVAQGAEIKAANRDATKKVDVRAVLSRYELAKMRETARPRGSLGSRLARRGLRAAFGPQLRLLLGALLVVGGLMWARQNQAALAGAEAVAGGAESVKLAKQQAVTLLHVLGHEETKPLSLPLVPTALTNLFDTVNPVVAGVVLVLSAFLSNPLAILLTAVGALLAFGGHKVGVVPELAAVKASHLTAAAGLACAAVAVVALRRRSRS